MTATAKLVTHGGDQAVCLPEEFRFSGQEVRISRIGDLVVLEPLELSPIGGDTIDSLGDPLFMSEGRDQPGMPPDRVTFDV